MQKKLSIIDLPLANKKVLMRVDFNVPLDKEGKITDDTRIKAALPSIQYVLDHGASLILMSHLGRPKGKKMSEFSLAVCGDRLEKLLKRPIKMASDCIGLDVEEQAKNLKPGEVLLLENLRFHRGEEKPEEDPSFAKKLASLGDYYVNDAFGTAHRAHASTAIIAKYFPGKAAAGFLMEKEIKFLGEALLNPKKPFYAIIGGAKISSKLGVIHSLIKKANAIFIGGGMAFTFLKAQGFDIGDSIHEDDLLKDAQEILNTCQKESVSLFLPQDHVIANKISEDAEVKIVDNEKGIPKGFQGVDIGPQTVQTYSAVIKDAATVLWNGPLGIFEVKKFALGTFAIAKVLANLDATTIVGGGDSIAALQSAHLADKITHLSTGGGASLEYIELGTLPGIEALTDVPFDKS